jgi:MFS transporter, CP family, cyanate transporter
VPKSSRSFWAVATVFFLTLLLRPPLAAIGPLLTTIQTSEHWSTTQLGLLTSTPVFCFGFGAFLGPRLLKRFGLSAAFTGILAVLTVTIVARLWFGFDALVIGTIAMGLGIAVSNVLFPALIRAEFPNSVAKMTAVYTTMLSGFSAVASGIAFPVSEALHSWQLALSLLAAPGILGLIAWRVTVAQDHPVAEGVASDQSHVNMWRHPLTWAIAAFFGLQSSNFYVMLNWLPTLLVDNGMSEVNAGGTLALMSMVGIPVGMLITANLKRIKNLSALVIAISIVTSAGLALYEVGPGLAIPASILTGIGLSSSFPLSLALIGMKGSNQSITTSMSAISQGMGYLFAAAAVFVAGLSHDLTGSWLPTIIGAIACSLIQAFAGRFALHHKVV